MHYRLLQRGGEIICLFVLLSLVALPAMAQDQVTDSTFLTRNIRQQLFVVNYLKENEPVTPPVTQEEVDALFDEIEGSWAETVKGEDPHMAMFNPYVAIWMVHSVYARLKAEISEETDCYTYTTYVIPAFLADYERFSDVQTAHAGLIRWGYDWAGGGMAFSCDMDKPSRDALFAAFNSMPALLKQYLDEEAYPEENIARQVRDASSFFERNHSLYALRNAIYLEKLDEAFAGFAALTTKKFNVYYMPPLGAALWKAYLKAGKKDHAIATLDVMARAFTAGDLERDTLLAWYSTVDSERGPERFAQMTATSLPALVASDQRIELTGTYTELLTGESVQLEGYNGKLVFLDFWATWCTPCIAEIPDLKDIATRYADHVKFLSINDDALTGAMDEGGVREFMTKHEIDFPVLYDLEEQPLAKQFKVNGYPAKFLIDPEGKLLSRLSDGSQFLGLKDVEAYLETLE